MNILKNMSKIKKNIDFARKWKITEFKNGEVGDFWRRLHEIIRPPFASCWWDRHINSVKIMVQLLDWWKQYHARVLLFCTDFCMVWLLPKNNAKNIHYVGFKIRLYMFLVLFIHPILYHPVQFVFLNSINKSTVFKSKNDKKIQNYFKNM